MLWVLSALQYYTAPFCHLETAPTLHFSPWTSQKTIHPPISDVPRGTPSFSNLPFGRQHRHTPNFAILRARVNGSVLVQGPGISSSQEKNLYKKIPFCMPPLCPNRYLWFLCSPSLVHSLLVWCSGRGLSSPWNGMFYSCNFQPPLCLPGMVACGEILMCVWQSGGDMQLASCCDSLSHLNPGGDMQLASCCDSLSHLNRKFKQVQHLKLVGKLQRITVSRR